MCCVQPFINHYWIISFTFFSDAAFSRVPRKHTQFFFLTHYPFPGPPVMWNNSFLKIRPFLGTLLAQVVPENSHHKESYLLWIWWTKPWQALTMSSLPPHLQLDYYNTHVTSLLMSRLSFLIHHPQAIQEFPGTSIWDTLFSSFILLNDLRCLQYLSMVVKVFKSSL